VGRDAGQAGPRDSRHVRAMSAISKGPSRRGGVVNRRHRQQSRETDPLA